MTRQRTPPSARCPHRLTSADDELSGGCACGRPKGRVLGGGGGGPGAALWAGGPG
ncbi:hypothetical protein [Nocardia abscessus]|uniref:hypothetical protein n=1 Tax=Nocardia abscessus TaxID=120957 RepID=UPI0024566262|nr:hypothetical protein [Nocardia abscessus]